MILRRGWIYDLFRRVPRLLKDANASRGAAESASTREVVLSDGDVDRLVVVTDRGLTRLVVYSGGEDEPLVQAVLAPEELRRLVAALQQQGQPNQEE